MTFLEIYLTTLLSVVFINIVVAMSVSKKHKTKISDVISAIFIAMGMPFLGIVYAISIVKDKRKTNYKEDL